MAEQKSMNKSTTKVQQVTFFFSKENLIRATTFNKK